MPLARILWAGYVLFILYVTALPFNFVPSATFARQKLEQVPRNVLVSPDGHRRPSIADMTQNVVMFVPFGALTFLAFGLGRRPVVGVLISGVAGLGTSLAVEAMQLFTADRTSSLNDLVMNASGALAGAGTAELVRIGLRRSHPRTLTRARAVQAYPLLLWGAVLTLAAWHPFDIRFRVATVGSRALALLADPWQVGAVGDELADALRYAMFGGAAALCLFQMRIPAPRVKAFGIGVVLAAGLEATQLFIGSRMPGLKDLGVAAAGVLAGVLLGGRAASRWGSVAAVGAAACAATAVLTLRPFVLAAERQPFSWAPFFVYHEQVTSQIVSHVIELGLTLFPAGYMLVRQTRPRLAVVIIAGVLLASAFEYLQGGIVGRYPDITDATMMALGFIAGGLAARPGPDTFADALGLGR